MNERANYQLIKEAFVQIEILVEQVNDLQNQMLEINKFLDEQFFEGFGEEE